MHNLSNYDSHLFIKELAKYTGKLTIIPENSDKCISTNQTFTIDHYCNNKMDRYMSLTRELRFLDTFRFLPSTLNTIASDLSKNKLLNLKKSISHMRMNSKQRVEKDIIHMIGWMILTNLMKKNYHQKRISTIY